jgi:transposase
LGWLPVIKDWGDGTKRLGYLLNLKSEVMQNFKKNFLGLDVSKDYFDVSLLQVDGFQKQPMLAQRFQNSPEGLKQLSNWMKANQIKHFRDTLVVMENTGIYHRLIEGFCHKHLIPIHIGNAAHMKWSFGITRGKTDPADSGRICEYAFKNHDSLKAAPALDPCIGQLKDLMAFRAKLLKQKNALKVHINELKPFNSPQAQKNIERCCKEARYGIDQSIKNVESSMAGIVKNNGAVHKNFTLLQTIPGIGRVTAIMLICSTNNFIQAPTGKQLSCYAGVAPFEYQSGSSVRGRTQTHHMANKTLKSVLHLGALTVIQHDREFKGYYDRKKEQGKHPLSIINAIKGKLLLRVAAVIKNQAPYEYRVDKAA